MNDKLPHTVNEFSHAWNMTEYELWHQAYQNVEALRWYMYERWRSEPKLFRDWMPPIVGADYQVLMFIA